MGLHHTDLKNQGNSKGQNATPEGTFSRIDPSGTSPNRYENIYSKDQDEDYRNSCRSKDKNCVIPGVEVNVSKIERLLMIAAGSFLVYKAIKGRKKNIGQGIAGGTMIARGISGYCPVYDAFGQGGLMKSANINIHTAVEVSRPINEVYAFWRNLENLPLFMKHLDSVDEKNNLTSIWKAKIPGGIGTVGWKAEILMDEPEKVLSWHSLPGSTIDNAGKVSFTKTGSGSTTVDVVISYHAPLGTAGEAAAKLLNPIFEKMVKKDIQNFKDYIESQPQHALSN